jgi:hypothetical protein
MKKIQEFWIDFKRGAGKQLLVFGALFLMNPWSFWYGLPVYLVGLILIWNSSISKKMKWRWTFMPLVIVGFIYLIIELIYQFY